MNNNMNICVPQVVYDAFPVLSEASYIRRFASLVPLSPDTIFDIFTTKSGQFMALVTTDYADPLDQGHELKHISGQYEFEFVNLIRPYANNETIEIREHDDTEGDCLIRDKLHYYYLANTKQDFSW